MHMRSLSITQRLTHPLVVNEASVYAYKYSALSLYIGLFHEWLARDCSLS